MNGIAPRWRMPRLEHLDLNKLQVFFCVVENAGVAGAARALGRTPSAVSQSVSSLESALGQRLFDRVGHQMVLTRAGQILHERFRAYQDVLARVLDEVANADGEVRGTVRVGLFLGFPRKRFSEFVATLVRRHRAMSVRVVYGAADELAARLERNRLDFAFSLRLGLGRRVDATRLFERELVLVSGKQFLAGGFDRGELGRVPIIDYYQGDPLIDRWARHHFGEPLPTASVVAWAATTDLVLDLVLEGAGVAVLPYDLISEHVRRGRLRVVRPGRRRLIDPLWLLEPRGAFRDVTHTAFRSAVLREFGSSDRQVG